MRLPEVCKFDPAYTIWSHYRGLAGGKGMGKKSADINGTYACSACDYVYDGQLPRPAGMTKQDVDLAWFQGHMRSMLKLIEKGLVK